MMYGTRWLCYAVLLMIAALGSSETGENSNDHVCAGGPCGLGYYCNKNSSCRCVDCPGHQLQCGKDGLEVLDCHCFSFDDDSESPPQVGACVFFCGTIASVHSQYYPITNHTCSRLNRTGALCGKCQANHYPLAYSYDMVCIPCASPGWNWVKYIAAAYLPLTLFSFAILVFRVNVISSHFHGILIFSQSIAMPSVSRVMLSGLRERPTRLVIVKILISFYGIWNLDFARPFYTNLCLGTGILPTLALDYAIAVYPLLLTIVSYVLISLYDRQCRVIVVLWKPFQVLFSLFFKNNSKIIRTSVIDAFSAFFLLSLVKFLSVSLDLLIPTNVWTLYGSHFNSTRGLYYAGNVEYFGREHLPYATLAIILLLVFVISPIAILALYPFRIFHKFLNLFPGRWYVLHTFVDPFQGCYKDGVEPGTHDCRWFSTAFLIFRCVSLLLCSDAVKGSYHSYAAIFTLLFLLLVVLVQPYKQRVVHLYKSNVSFLILYAINCAVISAINEMDNKSAVYLEILIVLAMFVASTPLLCILVWVLYLFFKWIYLRMAATRFQRLWHREYQAADQHEGEGDLLFDGMANPRQLERR